MHDAASVVAAANRCGRTHRIASGGRPFARFVFCRVAVGYFRLSVASQDAAAPASSLQPQPVSFLAWFPLHVVCCLLHVVLVNRVLSVALQDAAQPGRNSLADTLGGPPRAAVSADNGPPPYLALSSSAVSVPSAVSSSFTGAVRTSLQLPDLRRPYAWTVGQVKETANGIGAPHRTGGTRRYLSAVQ